LFLLKRLFGDNRSLRVFLGFLCRFVILFGVNVLSSDLFDQYFSSSLGSGIINRPVLLKSSGITLKESVRYQLRASEQLFSSEGAHLLNDAFVPFSDGQACSSGIFQGHFNVVFGIIVILVEVKVLGVVSIGPDLVGVEAGEVFGTVMHGHRPIVEVVAGEFVASQVSIVATETEC